MQLKKLKMQVAQTMVEALKYLQGIQRGDGSLQDLFLKINFNLKKYFNNIKTYNLNEVT